MFIEDLYNMTNHLVPYGFAASLVPQSKRTASIIASSTCCTWEACGLVATCSDVQ